MDVAIAGGGIIGLSIALELAAAGFRVVVLERRQVMSEASWAAAGMLAVNDPENPPALQALSELSAALYPEYLRGIERLSGLPVPLRTRTTLQGTHPSHASALPSAEAGTLLPDLVAGPYSFSLLDEASLDPRDLCKALPVAARAAGIEIREDSAVTAIRNTASGVEVTASGMTIPAAHFINCAGAWADELSNLRAIEPRKGQMVAVQLPLGTHLDVVIRTPELYLVPRGDGRVVIGASVERAGYDKSVQSATIQALIDQAAALWPPVRHAATAETWAGLRPGSVDGLPVLGPAGKERCWMASGHFRNGILLAPATARIMKQLLANETPSVNISQFRCDRFAAVSVSA